MQFTFEKQFADVARHIARMNPEFSVTEGLVVTKNGFMNA
jgi:hypothetical protein